jgi:hypothetical protein
VYISSQAKVGFTILQFEETKVYSDFGLSRALNCIFSSGKWYTSCPKFSNSKLVLKFLKLKNSETPTSFLSWKKRGAIKKEETGKRPRS